jgi:integrase
MSVLFNHAIRYEWLEQGGNPITLVRQENVKVVQELMRHASSRFTLEVYTQAKAQAKRDAQQRIAELILPEEKNTANLWLQRTGPDEMLGGN